MKVGLRDLTSALSLVWLAVVIPTTFSEPIALYLRRPESSRSYLIPQIWCGVMYFAASGALWLLRAWKLKDRDQKMMESSQETDTTGSEGVQVKEKRGLRKIQEKWKQGSRWWRYDFV